MMLQNVLSRRSDVCWLPKSLPPDADKKLFHANRKIRTVHDLPGAALSRPVRGGVGVRHVAVVRL